MPDSAEGHETEFVREAQEALLAATLLGRPLPGSDRPLTLPDIEFVHKQPSFILVDENLAPGIKLEGLPKPLEILPADELHAKAHREGDLTYIRFQPAEVGDDLIRLTLELRIAARDPERQPLGLSGVRVSLRRTDGDWQLAEEPALFAA